MKTSVLIFAIVSAWLDVVPVPADGRSATVDYHAGKSPADVAPQPAFVVEWPERVDADVVADVSFLLEAPACALRRDRGRP